MFRPTLKDRICNRHLFSGWPRIHPQLKNRSSLRIIGIITLINHSFITLDPSEPFSITKPFSLILCREIPTSTHNLFSLTFSQASINFLTLTEILISSFFIFFIPSPKTLSNFSFFCRNSKFSNITKSNFIFYTARTCKGLSHH